MGLQNATIVRPQGPGIIGQPEHLMSSMTVHNERYDSTAAIISGLQHVSPDAQVLRSFLATARPAQSGRRNGWQGSGPHA